MTRPSGAVTFLLTDIEASTRLWESDPEAMRTALASHDDVLRAAIESHGGWLFKHTGDGAYAVFTSPRAAIDTAIDAQRLLDLPVRMGVATGEVELRGDDYYGPTLNRAARITAAGHGGQILVAASTVGLIEGLDLLDLGPRRLRDLSEPVQIFQVRASGLQSDFPALNTVDTVPGNLQAQATSFVGRDTEIAELVRLVRSHRLVTLTGVGGVGKTRLAVQVAAESVAEFPDGVWLVELAPVGDPAALPDAVASALGVTTQAGFTVTDSIAQALSGRRLLVVMDNCEHVLDAAADLAETLLARTTTMKMIATSREGLRVPAEHLWPVQPLDVRAGVTSPAVELFVERARAVNPAFALNTVPDSEAVTEICRRLDGIALAIELAAARMVSMSAVEVRDRLGDRFRLLSGSRRGLERHQTLRHAVKWSYDLLDAEERSLLQHCSVFTGGFHLGAARVVFNGSDDYEVLDLLDSLVRKSLLMAEQVEGRTRYGLLETIRQFVEEQFASAETMAEVRDRHARYFADQAVAHWNIWDGPRQPVAADWVEAEFANLRAGFRWASDRGELITATAIAAHTTLLSWSLQRFEPVGWAEEILAAATAADVAQLPRLYVAAGFCSFTGRPEAALGYARTAIDLEVDPRYDPFDRGGWSHVLEANAHLAAGRMDVHLELCTSLSSAPGLAGIRARCGVVSDLTNLGRTDEARAIATETLAAAHHHGNPYLVPFALAVYSDAFAATDPARALNAAREGLAFAREHRLPFWEVFVAMTAATLEAEQGHVEDALGLFDSTIDSLHRAGNVSFLAATVAQLAVVFTRLDRPEIAATLYGTSTRQGVIVGVRDLPSVLDHLRNLLGPAVFEGCVAAGAARELGDAVGYARKQIHLAVDELRHDS